MVCLGIAYSLSLITSSPLIAYSLFHIPYAPLPHLLPTAYPLFPPSPLIAYSLFPIPYCCISFKFP